MDMIRIRDVEGAEPINSGRREALVRMGKFAGLTAPAVALLLTSDASEAWAASAPSGHSIDPRRQRGRSFFAWFFNSRRH